MSNTAEAGVVFRKQRAPAQIRRELRFLRELAESGYVPAVLGAGSDWLELEAITTEPVTDPGAFLVHCCAALRALREHGIIHGDLTRHNIRVRDNRPYLIDFAQSRSTKERRKDKRPEGDAYWMWQSYIELSGDGSRYARRWLAIRDSLMLADCRSILDLGCYRGDMALMAQAEGFAVTGLERDENVAFIAPGLAHGDMLERQWSADGIFLLSVFPYLVQQREWDYLATWIGALRCRRLYFESQLAGDGPGPAEFTDEGAVMAYLAQFGTVRPLVTIELTDRPARRTVFEVAL